MESYWLSYPEVCIFAQCAYVDSDVFVLFSFFLTRLNSARIKKPMAVPTTAPSKYAVFPGATLRAFMIFEGEDSTITPPTKAQINIHAVSMNLFM